MLFLTVKNIFFRGEGGKKKKKSVKIFIFLKHFSKILGHEKVCGNSSDYSEISMIHLAIICGNLLCML